MDMDILIEIRTAIVGYIVKFGREPTRVYLGQGHMRALKGLDYGYRAANPNIHVARDTGRYEIFGYPCFEVNDNGNHCVVA